MRETIDFRIPEENAAQHLPAGVGQSIGGTVRRVVVTTADPLFSEIGRLQSEFRGRGESFFLGRTCRRRYSRRELDAAELLHVRPASVFEPAGEECGTIYDGSGACPECGAGAVQVGPLFLDGRRIPRRADFARTIADEIVVSSRVVELFHDEELRGAEFEPIRLSNRGGTASQKHYQLKIMEAPVELHPATRAGEDPFDQGSYGRCTRGHVVGLNLLSEVVVKRESLGELDVMATKQRVGVRRGLLRPRQVLLISSRAWRAIEPAGLRGLTIEVAHVS
jgi:hypothetical protein